MLCLVKKYTDFHCFVCTNSVCAANNNFFQKKTVMHLRFIFKLNLNMEADLERT
jgi:hypothetical protein